MSSSDINAQHPIVKGVYDRVVRLSYIWLQYTELFAHSQDQTA